MKLLDLSTKSIVNIELLSGEVPVVVRWSPKKQTVAAVGYKSGRVSFVDVASQKTFSIEMFKDYEDTLFDVIYDMALDEEEKD